jgi:hypothetical protein
MEKITRRIDRNIVTQVMKHPKKEFDAPETVVSTWQDNIQFIPASNEKKGFRPAQIGALYAIKAHWTVSHEPAIIVMPTGTVDCSGGSCSGKVAWGRRGNRITKSLACNFLSILL